MNCPVIEDILSEEDRFALMIDGANLYQAARALGFDIDYRLLLDTFSRAGRLVRACYYTALLDDQEYSPIRPLVDWLDYNGYTVVTKPLKEFTDASGRRKFKGNMDMELAIDAMEMAQYLDHLVLFSGDGDFRRLTEALQRRGLRVTVVSTIRTQPPMIADELRRQADTFLELHELSSYIAREHRAAVAVDDDEDDDEDDDAAAASGAALGPLLPAGLSRPARAPGGATRPLRPAPPGDCALCPRLAAFRAAEPRCLPGLAQRPGRLVRRPGGAAADRRARPPGLRGANRTGAAFTGDHAGRAAVRDPPALRLRPRPLPAPLRTTACS